MTTSAKPKIAIVGYGSQGRAHALNLRDSGFDVTVGLRPGGPTGIKAKADGFTVKTPAEAVAGAELVAVLTPDMVQPQLYGEVIEPNIKRKAPACCSRTASTCIRPDRAARRISTWCWSRRRARARWCAANTRSAAACPASMRCTRTTAATPKNSRWPTAPASAARARTRSRPTFKEETETDLFGEQAVLCGGATELVQAGLETLVEAGYQPGVAYYEVPARTEADRRPVLRRRHHPHARIHLARPRNTATDPRPARGRCGHEVRA